MTTPGRTCPRAYGYSPGVFRRRAEFDAETVYVIGGLYGNAPALEAVLELAAAEPLAPRLVFNGDFNWFNVDPAGFLAINVRVLEHVALRGNVETEVASDDGAAGCGCGYPEWVGDAEVARSNAILERLRETARSYPDLRRRLGELPMHAVAAVGDARVAIVHGDAWSLAGWGFAQERLREDVAPAAGAFAAGDVDVFASSHTCLPVLQAFELDRGRCLIANNGAAGMPNFCGTRFGLITRIGLAPHPDALYGERAGPLHVQALPVCYDHERWLRHFDSLWPAGTPAAMSYRRRIVEGPAYARAQAVRDVVSNRRAARQELFAGVHRTGRP